MQKYTHINIYQPQKAIFIWLMTKSDNFHGARLMRIKFSDFRYIQIK